MTRVIIIVTAIALFVSLFPVYCVESHYYQFTFTYFCAFTQENVTLTTPWYQQTKSHIELTSSPNYNEGSRPTKCPTCWPQTGWRRLQNPDYVFSWYNPSPTRADFELCIRPQFYYTVDPYTPDPVQATKRHVFLQNHIRVAESTSGFGVWCMGYNYGNYSDRPCCRSFSPQLTQEPIVITIDHLTSKIFPKWFHRSHKFKSQLTMQQLIKNQLWRQKVPDLPPKLPRLKRSTSTYELGHYKHWSDNSHVSLMRSFVSHLNISDCWICSATPRSVYHGVN